MSIPCWSGPGLNPLLVVVCVVLSLHKGRWKQTQSVWSDSGMGHAAGFVCSGPPRVISWALVVHNARFTVSNTHQRGWGGIAHTGSGRSEVVLIDMYGVCFKYYIYFWYPAWCLWPKETMSDRWCSLAPGEWWSHSRRKWSRDGDSSVVRAPDSWLKGPGFRSLQERLENFLLQGRLSVLTLISVSVPPPCYRSST